MNLQESVLSLILQEPKEGESEKVFTDIQIETNNPIMWLRPYGWEVAPNLRGQEPLKIPDEEDMQDFLKLLSPDWKKELERDGYIDRPVELTKVRLRCNAYYTNGRTSLSVSIRKHAAQPLSLKEIGIPFQIENAMNWAKGLVVVTGATGSGKTTTLAAMLEFLNTKRAHHIITLENPIEYKLEGKKSVISQIEIPTDTKTFSGALRGAMRQNPDVIMIGEVRDKETAEAMFQAAESGHLIFATLHTSSAEGALAKMLSFFPSEEHSSRAKMLSKTLSAIICQSKIPAADGESSVIAHEILFNGSNETSEVIASPASYGKIRSLMKNPPKGDNSSCYLNDKLFDLYTQNKIAVEPALRASYNPLELSARIKDRAENKK